MVEFNQLEQLLAFAKYETLSKAAEKLLLSQPALTRSMQKLESDLGVALFERQKNKIALNDNGRLAVECAEKIMYDVHNMVERLHTYDRSKRTIVVGSCAPAPLWRLLPELAAVYPELTIASELKNDWQVVQGLKNELYQLIITVQKITDDLLLCYPYCQEHLLLSVPPAHPLAMYQNVSFADLAGETMLLFTEIGFWREICEQKMPHTQFIMQQEAATFSSLVKVSALPAFASDLALDQEEQKNRVLIPIRDMEANPTFYCVFHKKDEVRFAVFLDKLMSWNNWH